MQNFDNLAPGQVAIAIRPENSPDGKSKLAIASTAVLSANAVEVAMRNFGTGEFSNAAEIVANSKTDDGRTFATSNPAYLEFNEYEDGTKYIVYASPAVS